MNEGRKRAVWINISVVVFSLLLTTCVGSFSLMWIKHEIASVAQQTVRLEQPDMPANHAQQQLLEQNLSMRASMQAHGDGHGHGHSH